MKYISTILLLVVFASHMALSQTTITYDKLGRVISIQQENGTATNYTYDAVGNRLTENTEPKYELIINIVGNGTVEQTPLPINGVYNHGSLVTLTAAMENGWAFVGWGGDLSGDLLSQTITMNSNKSIIAKFLKTPRVIIINRNCSSLLKK